MSIRQQIENDLVAFLEEHDFNAPYGVLTDLRPLPKGGKVREVTFGIARTLDAVALIWSSNKITLDARGPASRDLRRDYGSIEALKDDLRKLRP